MVTHLVTINIIAEREADATAKKTPRAIEEENIKKLWHPHCLHCKGTLTEREEGCCFDIYI